MGEVLASLFGRVGRPDLLACFFVALDEEFPGWRQEYMAAFLDDKCYNIQGRVRERLKTMIEDVFKPKGGIFWWEEMIGFGRKLLASLSKMSQ